MNVDSVIFYTSDLDRTVRFYLEKIGFELDYRHENKYASFILSGGVRLGIKSSSENREKPGSQTLIIGVEDIDKIYNEMLTKDVEIHKPLTIESYGTEFSLLDPDGNKVEFIKRIRN